MRVFLSELELSVARGMKAKRKRRGKRCDQELVGPMPGGTPAGC
jgi:hypothetical protein